MTRRSLLSARLTANFLMAVLAAPLFLSAHETRMLVNRQLISSGSAIDRCLLNLEVQQLQERMKYSALVEKEHVGPGPVLLFSITLNFQPTTLSYVENCSRRSHSGKFVRQLELVCQFQQDVLPRRLAERLPLGPQGKRFHQVLKRLPTDGKINRLEGSFQY